MHSFAKGVQIYRDGISDESGQTLRNEDILLDGGGETPRNCVCDCDEQIKTR